MKQLELLSKTLIYIFAISFSLYSCSQDSIIIDDTDGILGETNAPVSIEVQLNKAQLTAINEGRLGLVDLSAKSTSETIIPVQVDKTNDESATKIILNFPKGEPGFHKFKLVVKEIPFTQKMSSTIDPNSKQIIIEEEDRTVLQYNYQTVYQKDVIRPESQKDNKIEFSVMGGVYYDEYLKAHPELEKNDTTKSSIYSVPRSNYIHPLYGLNGEILTNDWPDGGHPHHRGIFWAWPEVEYNNQRADIYALQRVFARPTGNINYTSGPVFAEIDAENLWMWEDTEAIINEHAIIRVYRSTSQTRIIDLTIKLLAIKDSVTIATRFTNSYGGLNIRMQSPENQDISYFTDEVGSERLRAWSDFNGIFEGSKTTTGLMVLQHNSNPEYPSKWIDYPGLAWVQPTFPTADTRYLLSKKEPLTLRYRLVVHAGGTPDADISSARWDAFNPLTPPFN